MERKEAIEIARKLYNESLFMKKDREAMLTLIPELAESEDERIRKAILELVKQSSCILNPMNQKSMIDWLEKQGKEEYALKSLKDEDVRKFMQYIEKEAKAYEFNLPNRGYDIYAFAKDILVWLEKQGEQKLVNEVKPKFKVEKDKWHNSNNNTNQN